MTADDDPTAAHPRFEQLSAAVAASRPGADADLLAEIRAEPDRLMAESVLTSLVDSRGAALEPAAFAAWAEPVLQTVGADGFVARRVREWGLFQALQSGAPVDRDALAASSNWLQRKVTEEGESAAALTALGEVGRTKKVRNLAKTRAGRLKSANR